MLDKDKDPVDAVFVIGTGSQNKNEELKYALRDLEHFCTFIRKVYIVGECPSWVDKAKVTYISWPDRFSHAKDANIIDKLYQACKHPEIANNILFCSDDQFVLRPCSWSDFSPQWLRQYDPDDTWYADRKRVWHTRLRATLERERLRREGLKMDTSKIYYYQPHMWMQISRDSFMAYANWSDYAHRDDTIIASGYFNFISAGGAFTHEHTFITSNQRWPVAATHIAYTDSSFKAAMQYLKSTFPKPSIFEIQDSNPYSLTTIATAVDMGTDADSHRISENIQRFKDKLSKEPVWGSVMTEVLLAEELCRRQFPGYREVWNEIVTRWASTTDNGRLRLPVDQSKETTVLKIINDYKVSLLGEHKSEPETTVKETTADDASSPGTKKKKCTKCEERKKKLQEAARLKAQTNLDKVRTELNKRETARITENSPQWDLLTESENACFDCALEHLAMAAAYINSNNAYPTVTEQTMAVGELRVAALQFTQLNCTQLNADIGTILDSRHSAFSKFTGVEIQKLITRALNFAPAR